MPLHDLICPHCGEEVDDFQVVGGVFPRCERCRSIMTWRPTKLTTDVCGSEIYDPILNLTYRSTRDRDSKMKARGYQPCGDRVGGAINQDGYKERLFSYGGQKASRRTPKPPLPPRRPDRVKTA